jgi:hypothetical protein
MKLIWRVNAWPEWRDKYCIALRGRAVRIHALLSFCGVDGSVLDNYGSMNNYAAWQYSEAVDVSIEWK